MKEIFYEESAMVQNEKSAARKFNTCKIVSIIFYVLMVFYLFLMINPLFATIATIREEGGGAGSIIFNVIYFVLPLLFLFFSGFVFGRLKNKLYVDYDYTFVSASIRISKVIKNYKRKFILKFDYSAIEKLGKYGSESYLQYEKMPGIKKLILTSNSNPSEGKQFYYLVINHEDAKKLLVLECTELFIVNILKFANRFIIEKDFK